jgi:predicted phage tail protein
MKMVSHNINVLNKMLHGLANRSLIMIRERARSEAITGYVALIAGAILFITSPFLLVAGFTLYDATGVDSFIGISVLCFIGGCVMFNIANGCFHAHNK